VDPGSVTAVGFLLAEKAPGPFSLEVEWIKVERQDAQLRQPRPASPNLE
jgi:hypothetical protein